MGEQKPANYATDNVACGKGNVDVERLDFRKSRRSEKDDRVAKEGIAAKDLGGPYYAVLREIVSYTFPTRHDGEGA